MMISLVDDAPRHKKKATIDGLSVERLTLLGRVSVARVTIDQLNLIGADLDTSSSRVKPKTKYGIRPPKPSPKAKKSWYVLGEKTLCYVIMSLVVTA